jgi:hypothetical protein
MKFVDIKNDIAFRKIFGNEKKKEILISFLNAVLHLEGDRRIKSISIVNPFQLPILPNMKTSIIDVKAKEYSQQIVSGEKYTELNPVIFIGIFDFPFTEGEAYFSHHAICNVETKERVIKDMDFYFIELPKFKKPVANLDNITDKWIYFIKEAENMDVIPDNVDDEGLKEAYADANQNTWSQAELDAYNYAAMREQDDKDRIAMAEQKAQQKGEEKKETEFVIEMHKDGLSNERIAKIAKMPLESVEHIIQDYKNTEGVAERGELF